VRLLVEVSDTTLEGDLGRKRLVYAAGGIPEYWVVDLAGQVVRQFWSPGTGTYADETMTPFGKLLASAALPGLRINTAALQAGD